MSKLQVLTLVENTVNKRDLLAEHGLSFLIKAGDTKILFDTGGGRVITNNAEKLNVDLSDLDAVVISHGHDDHTGGLETVIKDYNIKNVYGHPGIFTKRYFIKEDQERETGIPLSKEQYEGLGAKFILNEEPYKLSDDIIITGQIPRRNSFEEVEQVFYKEENGKKVPDEIIDDQSLIIMTSEGPLVVFGCAHSGVINILEYACELTGENSIYGIIGGTHLRSADDRRIMKTIEGFKRFNLQFIAVSHCTGFRAAAAFAGEFGDKFKLNNVGSSFEFNLRR